MRRFEFAIVLLAVVLSASQVPAQPQVKAKAKGGVHYDFYGLPTCREKVGLKKAELYTRWCLNWSQSYHPVCNVDNPCFKALEPVVAACDSQAEGIREHPNSDYKEMSICAEARRVFDPDFAAYDRREKAHDEFVSKHPGKPLTPEERLLLMKR